MGASARRIDARCAAACFWFRIRPGAAVERIGYINDYQGAEKSIIVRTIVTSKKGKERVLTMSKTWIEGRLGYNSQNDRYGLLVSDLWEYTGFHCGECLQVKSNGEWVDTSFEMDWSTGRGVWYLTGTDIKSEDIEYTRARIQKG